MNLYLVYSKKIGECLSLNETNYIAGVAPGGFKDVYLVRILICYILSSVTQPLSKYNLNSIFESTHLVDYFVFSQALAEIIESKQVDITRYYDEECYTLNKLGKQTVNFFKDSLPTSVRDNVVKAALDLIAHIKKVRENTVEFVQDEQGVDVLCTIHDTDFDLLSFKMRVPDMEQAEILKKNFLRNPQEFYEKMIGILLGYDVKKDKDNENK